LEAPRYCEDVRDKPQQLRQQIMSEKNQIGQVSDEQLEQVAGGVDFDQLRRENLDKDGVDFDQLRRENLDKDALSDDQLGQVAGGVDIDQLRRENLDKDAVDVDQLRRDNLEKD
jgi:hypothetical protein